MTHSDMEGCIACTQGLGWRAGEIMISAMGDLEGQGKGGFVLLDEDFQVCPLL